MARIAGPRLRNEANGWIASIGLPGRSLNGEDRRPSITKRSQWLDRDYRLTWQEIEWRESPALDYETKPMVGPLIIRFEQHGAGTRSGSSLRAQNEPIL